MIYILFAIAIVFSFFILYEFSKNDFVLLRRNISIMQMFDYVFVNLFTGFLFSRILYIFDTRNFLYLQPINLLHIFELPGLSVLGFFIGLLVTLYVLLRKKKVLLRAYDIFVISFFPILLVSVFYESVPRNYLYVLPIFALMSTVIFGFLVSAIRNYSLRDGSSAAILFMVVCLKTFAFSFFDDRIPVLYVFSLVQIIAAVLLILNVVFILVHQKIVTFPKR